MARPGWATKTGRMSEEERRQIEGLAASMKNPTPSKIARRLNRHPATVTWYMLRNGLIERSPGHASKPYMRNGAMVYPYAPEHDRRLIELRTDKPGRSRLTYREIGEILTREFSIKRDAHSVQVRMTQLACDPNIEAAS